MPLKAQELDWAKRVGGVQGNDVETDSAGNSYMTGLFEGTTTFGAGEANETTLTSAGDFEILVAKHDPSGGLLWAKRAGGTGLDWGFALAIDGAGNSYVTGRFTGTATFGPGEPSSTVMTTAGSDDMFVAKYNSSGALVWARRAGGSSTDEGRGIAVDSAGNSYVSGFFANSATFGLGDANQTMLSSAGSLDLFVAKYDPNGALVWAKRAGGSFSDDAFEIATDGAGNGYVTGRFRGAATFGPGEANETTLTSAGDLDLFVARYDPSGALVWAKRAGGSLSDEAFGIAADGAGNSYVTGRFNGTTTFGAGEANETTLTPAGDFDLFVARYASSGALAWAKRAGGSFFDDGLAIAMDGAGNGYATGFFGGTATFGAGEANETTLTSPDARDLFIARYDASGALVWATSAGGTGADAGSGVATDGAGSVYATGFFQNAATFGAGEVNETTITGAGFSDTFLARFSGVVDTDGDGIADGDDNCPDDANANQLDTDQDGDGDACDADDDNDTVADAADNCPLDANLDQADADGDGAGNVCDADLDGDGVQDDADLCVPTASGEVVNADGCSIADLVPCDNPSGWKNHGAYVSNVAKTAKAFLDLGLITEAEKDAIVSAAGQSQCGH